jgi:hypothetical protein
MERAKGTSALDTYSAVLLCAVLLCTVAAFNRRCTRRRMAWWGVGEGTPSIWNRAQRWGWGRPSSSYPYIGPQGGQKKMK